MNRIKIIFFHSLIFLSLDVHSLHIDMRIATTSKTTTTLIQLETIKTEKNLHLRKSIINGNFNVEKTDKLWLDVFGGVTSLFYTQYFGESNLTPFGFSFESMLKLDLHNNRWFVSFGMGYYYLSAKLTWQNSTYYHSSQFHLLSFPILLQRSFFQNKPINPFVEIGFNIAKLLYDKYEVCNTSCTSKYLYKSNGIGTTVLGSISIGVKYAINTKVKFISSLRFQSAISPLIHVDNSGLHPSVEPNFINYFNLNLGISYALICNKN